jgi:uncharacterized protein with HEPN domain
MKRDDSVYLQHVLDAISTIEIYLTGVDESAFRAQRLIQDGVIRQLEIIGEAVKHLSTAVRRQNPSIPWQDIAGLRDQLIHHYFGVDLDEVWLTATEDVPLFKKEIQVILNELKTEQ